MYAAAHGLILGFHGCDRTTAEKVVSGTDRLRKSENDYDWLGHGMYFWENNPKRALEYAKFLKKTPSRSHQSINEAAVLGAVIDLGYCLNLLESTSLKIIARTNQTMQAVHEKSGVPLPVNTSPDGGGVFLKRRRDCAVLELTHAINKEMGETQYDSVRAVFIEGKELYERAGFNEKNHIQICVRNPNCIKGFFLVRKFSGKWPRV